MGQKQTYKCNSCNYTVLVSGGKDVGMRVKTDTVSCENCREIVDVITEFWTDEDFDKSNIGQCPNCNSEKHIKKWSIVKRPCPKCSGKLNIANEGLIEMWD